MANNKIMTLICALALFALAGCSSDSGSPAPTAVDTTPPAVPAQLMGDSIDSQVIIYWAPNTTDTDFAGYKVYRVTDQRSECLTQAPLAQNMYVDDQPRGASNTYEVTAVDLSGNESAHASIDVEMDDGGHTYHPDQP